MKQTFFTFLDIPKLIIDEEKFISFFDQYCHAIETPYTTNCWHGFTLKASDEYLRLPNAYQSFENEVKREFPEILDGLALLPLKKIHRAQAWEQLQVSVPHVDSMHPSLKVDIPGPKQMRIMLLNQNIRPTFFVQKDNKIFHPKWNEVDTNYFAFCNDHCKHGALYYDKKYRKILCQISGELDIDKYQELLERSIQKYEKYSFQEGII